MLSTEDIKKEYEQFKKDLNIELELPRLLIMPGNTDECLAQIKSVKHFAEIALGDRYFDKKVNNKYLVINLYHEFTHILDRLTFMTNVNNEKEQRNTL